MKSNLQKIAEVKVIIEDLLEENHSHGLNRSLRLVLKELASLTSHLDPQKRHEYLGKVDKVQIGGGSHVLEGFVNVDIFEPADIIFDLREGVPFDNNSVNFIFSEHFMEHIDYPISVKKFVQECYRVLKDGGEIVVGVPDSEKILRAYTENDEVLQQEYMEKWYKNRQVKEHFNTYIDLVNYHFRDQDDDTKYNPHFWGYDFEKLKNLFGGAGFKNMRKWDFDPTIANAKREFGSIYIMASKK